VIVLDQTIISDDIAEKAFVCDLVRCKGACCAEGDYGAPLLESELKELDENLESIRPFLNPKGAEAIDREGTYVIDPDGDLSTTLLEGRECAFAIKDSKTLQWKCGIEIAWKAGKSTFRKPLSCHLYPIRITYKEHYQLLNYHRWHICNPACSLGEKLSIPVYEFLKEPLIRAYGVQWYERLCKLISDRNR
jgi:hypothetical protein